MSVITRVVRELEKQKQAAVRELERIDQALAALREVVIPLGRAKGGRPSGRRPRRKLSLAARRRIAAAQRRRWAKVRARKAG